MGIKELQNTNITYGTQTWEKPTAHKGKDFYWCVIEITNIKRKNGYGHSNTRQRNKKENWLVGKQSLELVVPFTVTVCIKLYIRPHQGPSHRIPVKWERMAFHHLRVKTSLWEKENLWTSWWTFLQTFSCLASWNVALMAGKYRPSPRRPQYCTLVLHLAKSLASCMTSDKLLIPRLGFLVIKTEAILIWKLI